MSSVAVDTIDKKPSFKKIQLYFGSCELLHTPYNIHRYYISEKNTYIFMNIYISAITLINLSQYLRSYITMNL